MLKILAANAAAALLAISAAPANAATIFDTGTPTFGGMSAGTTQWIAAAFDISQATTITDALSYFFTTDAGPLTIALRADSPTGPGAELYSTTIDFGASQSPAWRGATGVSWALTSPGRYWLALEGRTFDPTLDIAGVLQGAPTPAVAYAYANGEPDLSAGPSAYHLEARYATGLQIFGVSAVPEPATWALMIMGFGMAGSALRRRQSQVGLLR